MTDVEDTLLPLHRYGNAFAIFAQFLNPAFPNYILSPSYQYDNRMQNSFLVHATAIQFD